MDEARKIGVGEIQRQASEVLAANRRAIIAYLAILVPLTALASWLDAEMGFVDSVTQTWGAEIGRENGAFGLLALLASIAAQYLLFERMLLAGSARAPRFTRILGFVGLAIVTFLGVGLAAVLLIVPGLIVGSRWLMSPAFYVEDGTGVFEALRKSWDATKGNTGTVMLALFILVVIAIIFASVVGGVLATVGTLAGQGPGKHLLDAMLGELWTVILIAMSVGTFRLLGSSKSDLAETFS